MHQTNKRNQDLLGSWDSGVVQVSHFPALHLQTCCLIFFFNLGFFICKAEKLRYYYLHVNGLSFLFSFNLFFFLSLHPPLCKLVLFLVRTNWGSIETHLCKLKKKKTGEIKRFILWSRIVEKTHTQGENEGEKKERRGHEGREDERGKRRGNNCLQGLPQWFSV